MYSSQFFCTSSGLSLKISQKTSKIEEALSKVQEKECCVFWYIGSNGLKQGAVDFYRPHLTEVLKNGGENYLVDLSAWAAFKNMQRDLSFVSSKGEKITGKGVRILTCGAYFQKLIEIPEGSELCLFLQEIAQRSNLLDPSKEFDEVGFTIGQRFKEACPALAPVYHVDCAKTYSLVQYIEFLFLVSEILRQSADSTSIRFVLPNDEAKYYMSSLEEDLQKILKLQEIDYNPQLIITIDCFEYGEQIYHRPYNAPGRVVKNSIGYEQIVSVDALNPVLSKAEA